MANAAIAATLHRIASLIRALENARQGIGVETGDKRRR